MNSQLFIDTWGWLTLYDRRETSHQEAVDCYQNIISQQGFIYTTDYVLNETFTLFRTYASVTPKICCRVRQISTICLFAGFMQSDAPYQCASCVSPVYCLSD
ncbi:hypothetical protein [Anabaena sp. UHCC 0451]|uniref:hypothetical protein n=1 Tax=Anabaena sp. UHCC 0451 TaxID=2055235 RepID=UPI002B210034|nr:hypothetical protein [Anabaena sp. UHCC 0451]MEA5578335.1 hypothetical protein [Anabaena sp. UHCC 0451]